MNEWLVGAGGPPYDTNPVLHLSSEGWGHGNRSLYSLRVLEVTWVPVVITMCAFQVP